MDASVHLVKAVGREWDASQLPRLQRIVEEMQIADATTH
jgi:hypothetical protein